MATSTTLEVERKYDVDDVASVPPLAELPGVATVDHPVEHHLSAEYHDTEDLRLASRRITLRRRTGGFDAGWHLKLPAGTDERLEFHEPLGSDDAGVPEPLLRLIRVHTRDRPVAPVARLHTRRTIHRLHGPDGAVLADIADDRVRAETLVPEHFERRWREWEVELADGGPRPLLDAADEVLLAAGARPSAHTSKLERALGPQLPAASRIPPVPQQKATAGEILLAYLLEQVQVLKAQDPRVREDAPDAVHQMRVATRRMRSALATFRKLLDVGTANGLRTELQWVAGVLGAARDTEVMHQRLKEMLADEPDELVMGPVARRIELELGSAYRDAHDAVLRELDGERYFRLLDALDALLANPPLTGTAAKPARKVVPKLVGHDAGRLRKAVKAAKKHPSGDGPALHEARKCAKRLRYAAEAAAPLGGEGALRLAEAAHSVQRVLGDHQDSIVTRDLLRRLGAEAMSQGENGFSYGRLHALEQALALDAVSRFRSEWKHFPKSSMKK